MALKLPHTGATQRLSLVEFMYHLLSARYIMEHSKAGLEPPLPSTQIWAAHAFEVAHTRNLVCSVMKSELDDIGNC